MGEVRVEVELADAGETWSARRGLIPVSGVTRVTVSAVVDTGATSSVLPAAVADRLGVRYDRTDSVILADGSTHQIPVTEPVELMAMDRKTVEQCLVMGDEVLLGQFFLEQADLFVDCLNQRLVGNPEHPDRRVHKVRTARPAARRYARSQPGGTPPPAGIGAR